MKPVRLLRLLVLACLAAGLLAIGPASSSATALCEDATIEGECAVPYEEGTEITAKSTSPTLKTNVGNVICGSSLLVGETAEPATEKGEALMGQISSLTFVECSMGKSACEMESEELPYETALSWTSESNGTFQIQEGTVRVKCGIVINCKYNAESFYEFTGGKSASFSITEGSLAKKAGFLCPKTTQWTASYALSKPNEGVAFVAGKALSSTVLCDEHPAGTPVPPCPAGAPPGGHTYPINTEIKAELNGVKDKFEFEFEGFSKVVKCEESKMKAKTTFAAAPLIGTVEELKFPSCEGACSVVSNLTPYQFTIEAERPSTGNGEMVIGTPASPPNFIIHCGPNFQCKYEGSVPWILVGGNPATFEITGALIISNGVTEPNCSLFATWKSKYKITTPTPLYVERAG